MRSQLLFVLSVIILAGCSPTMVNRGNLLDPEKVASLKPGVSNRDSVLNTLGTPSARASFNDNTWYYIGRRTEQYSFLDPEVTEQQLLTVVFDEDGMMQKLEQTGKDKIASINPASDETQTFGHETTWLQDLFGNIGRAGVPLGKNQR
ncbi:MAG: outer membrane protein assembly factor BamE [Alphaproteobacteria bacterium]|nr:outer membrane protein assembly factor BamE [Alphaproteobacteria bacterium]